VSLARFGVTKPVPVNLLMVAVLLAGAYCAANLRREFFPETEPDRAQIVLPYPGATPAEIEESLARKVEDAVADLDEVKRIETTLSEGGGGVVVEFYEGVNVDKAIDEVEREIDRLTDLPEEAEELVVIEFEPNLPVIMVSLFGDADEDVLKRAIRRIRDDLKTLPGMGDIIVSGVRDYELRVDVDAGTLLEYSISLPQVADAVRAWMSDVPGGSVRTNVGTINVRTEGVQERAEAIRQIVVRGTPEGGVLRVGDIARVREDFVDTQLITRFGRFDGLTDREAAVKPSVSLTVFKTGDQDAVAIAEAVRAYVAGRRGEQFEEGVADRLYRVMSRGQQPSPGQEPPKTLRRRAWELGFNHPEPLPGDVATHSDLARFIEGRLELLLRNAQSGGILVFLTLLLFLNWRAAFWVGVGLVIALSGTLVFMSIGGITLNLLTMFGLIVVLGMLVDDAIVVAENIQSRHDRGEPALSAAIGATEQVTWPVFATVTTTIVAFLPLMFIRGNIGTLLGALPLVVACALLMSLIESLYMLPTHMAHSLKRRDRTQPGRFASVLQRYEKSRDRFINDVIIERYSRFVRVLLEYRYISTSAALAILIISLGMIAGGRLEFIFLPTSDAETIIVDVRLPIGSPLEQTEAIAQRIEDAIADQPEARFVSTVVGARTNLESGTGEGASTHVAQIFVELTAIEQRDRESSQVIDAIRAAVGPLPEAESLRFQEIGGGPGGPDITVEVFGADMTQVTAVVDEIKELLANKQGVVDISDDNYDDQRELKIRLKAGAAALGLTNAEIARQVRASLFGQDAHVFSAAREDIDVRVRLDESWRRSLGAVETMWIITPTGARVPLTEIAELAEGTGYSIIRRVNRERAVTVTADCVPGTNPELVMEALAPLFREIDEAHPGVKVDLGGRQRDFIEAFSTLPIGAAAAMVMIYVILAWLFSSYTQPLAVMLAIPFGIIGVVWGHLLLGYDATFLSLIGFVALAGIVVNDSLIYVEFFNAERKAGKPLREALELAGRARLRAIFLTTITTVLGLTPLMLEQSFQAKFLIPMAISIAFGLMSATVLILCVLPCMLVILDDIKAATHFLWHGRSRTESAAEREASATTRPVTEG
jgi:HAE1 family hydrophobic/amphiphilic exporter-1